MRALALHTVPMYLAGRAAVIAGAAVVAAELRVDGNIAAEQGLPNPDIHGANVGTNAIRPIVDVFTSWDGLWYLGLVRNSYPTSVPPGVSYWVPEARAAFFPLYPWLARVVDRVLPAGDVAASLILNVLLGFVAVLLAGLLAERLYGEAAARRAITLMAIFPGSFVFSFAYSEALMMTLAAACLWALVDRRWWLASLFGALATNTRPNGLAVVAAAIVAAVIVLREPGKRDWKALLPVFLTPLGFVSFQLYLWNHTGEPSVWFRVQREAWDEGASFGWTAITTTFDAFVNPLTSPGDTITALTVISTIALVYVAWKIRLNPILTAYSATVLLLMLTPATVTARPRFLFTAFPLILAAGVWFDRHDESPTMRDLWTANAVLCGAGLAALTGVYGVFGAIP